HFWAQYFLGICYLRLHHPAVARAHFTACIGRRPELLWPYVYRGFALGELGAFEAAEADYRKALELAPTPEASYTTPVNRSVVRLRRGDVDGAIADLDRAVALMPDQYQAYVNLAQAYHDRKAIGEAVNQLDKAIRIEPNLAFLHRARA